MSNVRVENGKMRVVFSEEEGQGYIEWVSCVRCGDMIPDDDAYCRDEELYCGDCADVVDEWGE